MEFISKKRLHIEGLSINPKGEIKLAEVNDNSIGRNADELLRKVKAAQYVYNHPDEVCPAKWEEGEKH